MIAIHPVRANPPHLGHIITLLRIKNDYDKIIVAVSDNTYDGKKPQIIPQEEVKFILNEVFKHFPKYEVILSKERFITRTNFADLPKFDIVVTGNKAVYDNMIKNNINVRFIKRTPIYRSRFIRESYERGMKYEKRNFSNNGCGNP